MTDSAFEVGRAQPKDFENLVEGAGRAAAASGQIRRTSTGSSASGQISITDAPDSDSASDAESEKGSASVLSEKGSTVACGIVLDIIFKPGSKIPTCFLCGVQANAPTPLKSGHDLDSFGGLHPWNSYSKVYAEDSGELIGKTPKGCVCAISRNCYNAIGFNVKYGGGGGGSKSRKQSMAKYKKLMAKKDGVEIHKNFRESENYGSNSTTRIRMARWA